MVSWWVLYLAKGPGMTSNFIKVRMISNLCPTRIIASPKAIPILGQMEVLLFRYPSDGILVGAISGQGPQI